MLGKNIEFVGDSQKEACFALGRQLTIEYYECGESLLLDEDRVEEILLKAANDSGQQLSALRSTNLNPRASAALS